MVWMQYLMMKEVNHYKQITFTTFTITSKIIATVHLLVVRDYFTEVLYSNKVIAVNVTIACI